MADFDPVKYNAYLAERAEQEARQALADAQTPKLFAGFDLAFTIDHPNWFAPWNAIRFSEWAMAVLDNPEGATCHFCDSPNLFADDCGFFYIDPEHTHDMQPVCEPCFRGEPGRKHVDYYGMGER
jgi:hypothetical protein